MSAKIEFCTPDPSRRRPPLGSRSVVRPGFTLLELILALGLTALILALVSAAVRLHLTVVDQGREEVEHAEAARAVLRYIAADLRNAVRPTSTGDQTSASGSTPSASGTSSAAASGSSKSASGSNASSRQQRLELVRRLQPVVVLDWAVGSGRVGAAATTSAQTTVNPVGLYGSQTDLQVDISRLPRIDQYDPNATVSPTGTPAEMPTDVKTVAYFLRTADATSSGSGTPSGNAAEGPGLVRRETDRAVQSWVSGNASGAAADTSGQLLAAEVTRLEFRYWDGTSWATEWDSQEQDGLPMAVEITLGITPATANGAAGKFVGSHRRHGHLGRHGTHVSVGRPGADGRTQSRQLRPAVSTWEDYWDYEQASISRPGVDHRAGRRGDVGTGGLRLQRLDVHAQRSRPAPRAADPERGAGRLRCRCDPRLS